MIGEGQTISRSSPRKRGPRRFWSYSAGFIKNLGPRFRGEDRKRGKPFGRLLLLAAALSLAACYTSGHLLLDPDEAAHPFEDGTYERADDSHAAYHLTREPDGWYGVEEVNANGTLGLTHRVLFTPLPVGDLKAYAAAEETEDGFTYAVVIQQGERVYLATPDCADPLDASLAVDQGARQDDDEAMTHNCFFSSREAVTAALGDYAGQADFGAPYLKK